MPDPIDTTRFSDTILPINLPSVEDDNVQQQNEEKDRLLDTQGGEDSRWYATNQSVGRISDFIGEAYTKTKLLIGAIVQGDYIYGSVQYEDRAIIVIRLTSAKMDYAALKYYVVGLITQIRDPYATAITWQKEYFQENNREQFLVGESWDEFPYPHPSVDALRGFTAWLARDGRAEIIVRKRDDRP